MPTHYPAGPWIRSQIFCGNSEDIWQNDLWFKPTGSIPSGTDINLVAAAVDTALEAAYVGLMNQDSQYLGNNTYINNTTYTDSAETQRSSPGDGIIGALPTEDAIIVRINAGVATRAGAGRIFVGGIDQSMVSGSRLSDVGSANATVLRDAMMGIATLSIVPCKLAVWSRKLNALDVAAFADAATILGHRSKRRPIH